MTARFLLIVSIVILSGCESSVPHELTAKQHSVVPDESKNDTSSGEFESSSPAEESDAVDDERSLAANALLDEGIRLANAGEYDDALARWASVIADFSKTHAWPKAVTNSGRLFRQLEQHEKAVVVLEKLLSADVNNKEPTGFLASPYRNYQHWACLDIAQSYESLGNVKQSLKYAILARDKFTYQTWCGTCAVAAEQRLESMIARLQTSK
jgi:tetratricopeptide (TPR) repeat protein